MKINLTKLKNLSLTYATTVLNANINKATRWKDVSSLTPNGYHLVCEHSSYCCSVRINASLNAIYFCITTKKGEITNCKVKIMDVVDALS